MKKFLLISLVVTIVPIVAVVLLDARNESAHEAVRSPNGVATAPSQTQRESHDSVDSNTTSAVPADSVTPSASDSTVQTTTTPPSDPIPVATSMARLVDANNPLAIGLEIPRLHRALEVEAKDLSRAPQLEYDIQSYLQSNSGNNTYTIERVECRTTMCELQVTASNRAARAEWSKLLTDMRRQPWADAITDTVHSAQEDDATNTVGLITILRLRPVQTQ